jgi:hypothetical protein
MAYCALPARKSFLLLTKDLRPFGFAQGGLWAICDPFVSLRKVEVHVSIFRFT